MLFVNHTSSAVAAKDYFTRSLEPSDYPFREQVELTAQWHGLGAELLGLTGPVDKESYFRMCDNRNPITGEQLTPRVKADRRILYDFTFDVPKSVSLAYELGDDAGILDATRAAVQETMAEMERAVMTRVRTGGSDTDRATSNMVWAEFVHRTTRPVDGLPDPQLHCHAVAFNCTFDPVEERWKAAQFSNLVRDKGYYQAAFHSRLAGRLREVGYGIEKDGNSFRLAGIDRDTCDIFSRRTAIIEAEAERLGIIDPKAKGELGRRTRGAKLEGNTIAELRDAWRGRVTDAQYGQIVGARSGQETRTLNAVQAMDYSLSHCFERESVVTEKELLKQALMQSVGNASVQEIRGEELRSDIIRRDVAGQAYVTTKDVYREELAMVAFARDGRGMHRKLRGATNPRLDPALSREQREAALVILNSRDVATLLRGAAGAGKTRMMQSTVKAIEAGGKQVFTFAPSAKSSRGVLRDEGFSTADTVERLLTDAKLQHEVHGGVLWIDEAGLMSVRDMNRVFDIAKRQQCRVVLSGDSAQHHAVARGDSLRILEAEAGMKVAALKEIRRQTNEDYRMAVSLLSEGDRLMKDGRTQLEAGIDALGRMGAIVEVHGDDRYRHIAADYVGTTNERKAKGEPKSVLVVAPTHLEGARVTECIREGLKAARRLGGTDREFTSLRAVNLTEAERTDAANYRPGRVVQYHQNAKGFKRGERVRVTAVDPTGIHIERETGQAGMLSLSDAKKFQVYEAGTLALAAGEKIRITQNGFTRESARGLKKTRDRLNNGDIFEVDSFTRDGNIKLTNGFIIPKEYGNLTHGYTATSHASQGTTVDAVLVALGHESFAAANREQLYVSVSRGREKVRLYTDDKAAMLAAVQASAARLSATELMQGQAAKVKRVPGIMSRMLKMRTIQRSYEALKARAAFIGGTSRRPEEVTLGR